MFIPPPASRRTPQGFTLVELVVALLVLAVGLLGLASLKAMALQQNQRLAHRIQQADQARNLLEHWRAWPLRQPRLQNGRIRRDAAGNLHIRIDPAGPTGEDYVLKSRL
jgi:prepilin-type N-terminal cleavage/methylation domain-containing protein